MDNIQFQFHDPTDIIDFYFIALQYAKDTSTFYSKFLISLQFKVYSIANIDDIVVIIVNSENELEQVKKMLQIYFGEMANNIVSGNAFSLITCVDDIMTAKKNNVFVIYDITVAEEEERQKKKEEFINIKRHHEIKNILLSAINQNKLQQDDDNNEKSNNLLKWKEKESEIKERTYKTYIPRQIFINIFNKTDESHVVFMFNYVLGQILRACPNAIVCGNCDLLRWRVELIDCIWEYADELQNDGLINRFYNFKSQSNINIINHFRNIHNKNKNICLYRWEAIKKYYETNILPRDYTTLLGKFISNEFIEFINTGRFSREKFIYEEFKKKTVHTQSIFPIIYPDRFNTFCNTNGVSNIISSFLRKKKNIKTIVDSYNCFFLLYMTKLDTNSTINYVPKDILHHIVHFMMF
jgi:hypothetical protein